MEAAASPCVFAPCLQSSSMTDALDVAGRVRLHRALDWYSLMTASAAGGFFLSDQQRSLAVGSCPG
jgi:hypothetical protein